MDGCSCSLYVFLMSQQLSVNYNAVVADYFPDEVNNDAISVSDDNNDALVAVSL